MTTQSPKVLALLAKAKASIASRGGVVSSDTSMDLMAVFEETALIKVELTEVQRHRLRINLAVYLIEHSEFNNQRLNSNNDCYRILTKFLVGDNPTWSGSSLHYYHPLLATITSGERSNLAEIMGIQRNIFLNYSYLEQVEIHHLITQRRR